MLNVLHNNDNKVNICIATLLETNNLAKALYENSAITYMRRSADAP